MLSRRNTLPFMIEEISHDYLAQPGAWAIIHCPNRKTFLFGKRSNLVSKAGAWNFFGGRIDPGEEVIAALIRELQEETGFVVAAHRLHELACLTGVKNDDMGRGSLRQLHYYLLITDSEWQPTLNQEHSEFAWLSPDQLPERFNRPTAFAIRNGLLDEAQKLAERRFYFY